MHNKIFILTITILIKILLHDLSSDVKIVLIMQCEGSNTPKESNFYSFEKSGKKNEKLNIKK